MPSKKPYSWQREWEQGRDFPPKPHARELNVASLEVLATRRISMPPMGQYLFSQTREVEIEGAIEFAQGRSHGHWVYYRRGDRQFVRAFVTPRDPKTPFQLDQRLRLKQVQISWNQMTWEQRQGWDRFAATIPKLAWDTGSKPQQHGYRANRLYRSAQLSRLAMGLPVRNDAPTLKVTRQINSVEIIAAPQPGQIAFRLFHGGKVQPGLRVMVEMTRPMPSLKRCPRENELTKAGATEIGSYFDLGDNGATYVLDSPRYQVAPGQRFGLRVTMVSEEGLRSRSVFETRAFGMEPTGQIAGILLTTKDHKEHKETDHYLVSAEEVHRQHREMFEGFRNRRIENPICVAEMAALSAEVKARQEAWWRERELHSRRDIRIRGET